MVDKDKIQPKLVEKTTREPFEPKADTEDHGTETGRESRRLTRRLSRRVTRRVTRRLSRRMYM